MCVIKIHAFTSMGRPPSWSGTSTSLYSTTCVRYQYYKHMLTDQAFSIVRTFLFLHNVPRGLKDEQNKRKVREDDGNDNIVTWLDNISAHRPTRCSYVSQAHCSSSLEVPFKGCMLHFWDLKEQYCEIFWLEWFRQKYAIGPLILDQKQFRI